MDIIYRFDPDVPLDRLQPDSAAEAREILETGNRQFCEIVARTQSDHHAESTLVVPCDARLLGVDPGGGAPRQEPFVALVGCADARVPPQMIFQRMSNEMFVVRVAGNVIGEEVLASVEYALEHLRSGLRLVVVLGHSGCGAVTAAVDVYLKPLRFDEIGSTHAVRALVYKLLFPVHAAARSLEVLWGSDVAKRPGYRAALVELAVCMNAAETAFQLRGESTAHGVQGIDVAFGVYDLTTQRVGLPFEDGTTMACLTEAPDKAEGLVPIAESIGRSEKIRRLLVGT
jgi:carbonic anhydrase